MIRKFILKIFKAEFEAMTEKIRKEQEIIERACSSLRRNMIALEPYRIQNEIVQKVLGDKYFLMQIVDELNRLQLKKGE